MEMIESLASIISSIATFMVAVLTLYNVITLRKQIQLLEKQTLLQRSTVYPFLEIRQIKVRGNDVSLTLENVGKGIATQIGLRIWAIPMRLAKNLWDFDVDIYDIRNSIRKRMYPDQGVVFLKDSNNHFRLHPRDKKEFSATVYFFFKDQKKESFSGRFYSFDDFVKLLEVNKVRFAAVDISLVYKDISENIIESEGIDSFVIDITQHKSLEDAMKRERIPFTQRALSLEEIPFGLPGKMYEKMKSWRAFLEKPFRF